MADDQSIRTQIAALFAGERETRRCHDELVAGARGGAWAQLLGALQSELGAVAPLEPAEASLRLVCVARLAGEFDGPEVVDLLINVLDSKHPDARSEAGEQLQGLAGDHWEEFRAGVERGLARLASDSPALLELPFVAADVAQPGVVELLGQLLGAESADVAACALEALAEVGDPAALTLVEPLVGDERAIVVDEDELADEPQPGTLGQVASSVLELLRAGAGPAAEEESHS